MRRRSFLAVSALIALVLVAAEVWWGRGGREDEPWRLPGANVVVVMVDTLRADHLGAYGYARPTSPNLDRFAAGAVLFEQARSQASCTYPSVNSLLTSRAPTLFWGQPEGRMGIPEGIPSLAEMLGAAGYATASVTASPIVRRSPTRFNPHGGFDRGFDTFREECLWQEAACLTRQVDGLLGELQPPFFLYLHYMDPHGPYRPPADHPQRFTTPYEGYDFIAAGDPNPIQNMLYKGGPEIELSPRDLEHLVDLYDEEIAYFDGELARLLELLQRRGLAETTVVALVADHGEEFLEHGHIKHCRPPFDTQVKTPLVLRLPGGPAGVRLAPAVENLDLVPTLLDYLALPAADPLEGDSLRSLIEGEAVGDDEPRLAYSVQGTWRAITDGRFKLLFDQVGKSFQLYDLATDPGETVDRLAEEPQAFRRLRWQLFERLRATEGDEASQQSIEAAEEAEQRLKALGYL